MGIIPELPRFLIHPVDTASFRSDPQGFIILSKTTYHFMVQTVFTGTECTETGRFLKIEITQTTRVSTYPNIFLGIFFYRPYRVAGQSKNIRF